MKKLIALIVIILCLLHTIPAMAVASDEGPRMFTIYLPLVEARYRLDVD